MLQPGYIREAYWPSDYWQANYFPTTWTMVHPGYLLAEYWPGSYWQSNYFPTGWAASWYKIALEEHDAEFADVTASTLVLADTTTDAIGIVYKGADRFMHNFKHPTGNTAIPTGLNTFLGKDAGNFTSGSTATQVYHASYNTGIGSNALEHNTIGFANNAAGASSLTANTEGNYNNAMGSSSLQANTKGSSNNAMGSSALFANTLGNYNNAVGANAMLSNTEGIFNNAVGYSALRGNTVGSYNAAVGAYALYTLTSGSRNVALGTSAGQRQTSASGLLIIDNQDRGSAAAELTNCLIRGEFNATPASQSLRFNVGSTTFHNATHEDTDGGRLNRLNFKGQQSGGEETTLARIDASHDGTADDQKGKVVISTNAGSDGDTPTGAVTIDSAGALTATTLNAGNGFTGTGSYTNFTIVNGIITAAS